MLFASIYLLVFLANFLNGYCCTMLYFFQYWPKPFYTSKLEMLRPFFTKRFLYCKGSSSPCNPRGADGGLGVVEAVGGGLDFAFVEELEEGGLFDLEDLARGGGRGGFVGKAHGGNLLSRRIPMQGLAGLRV